MYKELYNKCNYCFKDFLIWSTDGVKLKYSKDFTLLWLSVLFRLQLLQEWKTPRFIRLVCHDFNLFEKDITDHKSISKFKKFMPCSNLERLEFEFYRRSIFENSTRSCCLRVNVVLPNGSILPTWRGSKSLQSLGKVQKLGWPNSGPISSLRGKITLP